MSFKDDVFIAMPFELLASVNVLGQIVGLPVQLTVYL
jgi:hypothetical protein